MPRYAARADGNQPEVVNELRSYGCSVQHLHTQGMGCPDIMAGFRGRNYLFEIKDPSQPPSGRKLTQMEARWHELWNGQVHTILTADDAMKIMLDDGVRQVPIVGEIS